MENFLKETNPSLFLKYKKEIYKDNYEQMKKWRANNKEKFKAIKNKWAHKEFVCECGFSTNQKNKSRHMQSKKHFKLLTLKQNNKEEPIKETEQEQINRLSAESDKLLGLNKRNAL
jgi:hypothetical protein